MNSLTANFSKTPGNRDDRRREKRGQANNGKNDHFPPIPIPFLPLCRNILPPVASGCFCFITYYKFYFAYPLFSRITNTKDESFVILLRKYGKY
jgi:hypothetical protein